MKQTIRKPIARGAVPAISQAGQQGGGLLPAVDERGTEMMGLQKLPPEAICRAINAALPEVQP